MVALPMYVHSVSSLQYTTLVITLESNLDVMWLSSST